MRCIYCNTPLAGIDYCTGCGADITIQKRIVRISNLLYNGNPLHKEWIRAWQKHYETVVLRVYDSRQNFVGIYRWKESSRDIRPIKILME